MTKTVFGDRIARDAALAVVCSAAILDSDGRILLTRRRDNQKWCLPGGHLESGESVAEGVVREVKEETGLDVSVVRLVGVYSSPDRIVEYHDGSRFQVVALNFEVAVVEGALTVTDETSEFVWCPPAGLEGLDIVPSHLERIHDAFASKRDTFVR